MSSFEDTLVEVIKLGPPHPWDENGEIHNKEEYKENLMKNKNEVVQFDVRKGLISEDAMFDRLRNEFQFWYILKNMLRKFKTMSY